MYNDIKYYKKHHKIDQAINQYNFKKIWKKKCSKYNKSQLHRLPAVPRIIVIGDIHGDFDILIQMLKIAKLIDANYNWIGNNTIVVQLGDQIDRCRYEYIPCSHKEATQPDEGNDWKILQFLTKLHHKAQQSGGAIFSLLGNHELMNVDQDLSYVSYEGLREFDNLITPYGIIKDGTDARKWAFKKGNMISEFLACTRQVALIIGSNLFVHGGILPDIAKKYKIKNINKLMTLYLLDKLKDEDIQNYKDIVQPTIVSPLWTRTFANITNESDCNNVLVPLKTIYNVDRIFVGHTPMLNTGPKSICNEKIWLADYGASTVFNKFDTNIHQVSDLNYRSNVRKANVLEILNDGEKINILY